MRPAPNLLGSLPVAVATLAVLAFVPTNIGKLVALLVVWAAAFWPLRRGEVAIVAASCVLFTVMNAGALRQGIFAFRDPDIVGLPVWELLMWGFYILLVLRAVGGPPPKGRTKTALVLAIVFAAPFSTISDSRMLLLAACGALAVALAVYHEPLDLAYAGYMLVLGAAVEYAGVSTGLWRYPDPPPGGVPFWFAPMWAGIGLFTRRLMLPLARRVDAHGRPRTGLPEGV